MYANDLAVEYGDVDIDYICPDCDMPLEVIVGSSRKYFRCPICGARSVSYRELSDLYRAYEASGTALFSGTPIGVERVVRKLPYSELL